MASPFILAGVSEDEMIKPAVEGTKALLEACLEFGIKKCIITSSMVTVMGADNIKNSYGEEDFVPGNGKYLSPYGKSKVLAEQCCREFMKTVPPDSPLEIITIHPGFITGKPESLTKRSG